MLCGRILFYLHKITGARNHLRFNGVVMQINHQMSNAFINPTALNNLNTILAIGNYFTSEGARLLHEIADKHCGSATTLSSKVRNTQ
jgi:hypothetical protein